MKAVTDIPADCGDEDILSIFDPRPNQRDRRYRRTKKMRLVHLPALLFRFRRKSQKENTGK